MALVFGAVGGTVQSSGKSGWAGCVIEMYPLPQNRFNRLRTHALVGREPVPDKA